MLCYHVSLSLQNWKLLLDHSYLESQVDAVAEMDALQAGSKVLAAQKHPVGVPPHPRTVCGLGKRKDGLIGNATALDQAYALQLGQGGQASDRHVREERAAPQINVADAVAAPHQADDALVGDLAAVAEMNVVQVLAKLGDGVDGGICNVAALGKEQVPQTGRSIDNLGHGCVRKPAAGRRVEDPQVLVDLVRRQGEEGVVVDQLAVG